MDGPGIEPGTPGFSVQVPNAREAKEYGLPGGSVPGCGLLYAPRHDPEAVARDLLALSASAPDPTTLLAAAQELLERARREREAGGEGDGKVLRLGG